jgi:hypothetical protein
MTESNTDVPTRALEEAGQDRATGRFLKGNRAAVKHLAHVTADRWPAWVSEAVDAFYAASVADDGGESEIPTRRRATLQARAQLHGMILATASAIRHFGITNRKGQLREAWLRRFESQVGTALRIDQALGFGRRERDALTLNDYLDHLADQEASQTRTCAPGEANDTALDREVLPDSDVPTGETHD